MANSTLPPLETYSRILDATRNEPVESKAGEGGERTRKVVDGGGASAQMRIVPKQRRRQGPSGFFCDDKEPGRSMRLECGDGVGLGVVLACNERVVGSCAITNLANESRTRVGKRWT